MQTLFPLFIFDSNSFSPLSFRRDMTSSPLIFVPKKQTTDIDFSPYVRPVISKVYSESPSAFTEQIGSLNRSRQDALRGIAGSDSTARDLLLKYFGMLELLELRFPELRVPFPWSVESKSSSNRAHFRHFVGTTHSPRFPSLSPRSLTKRPLSSSTSALLSPPSPPPLPVLPQNL